MTIISERVVRVKNVSAYLDEQFHLANESGTTE